MAPPSFLRSWSGWTYTCVSILSPVVLVRFLFTPAMPSTPDPRGLRLVIPSNIMADNLPTSDREYMASSSVPVIGLTFSSL